MNVREFNIRIELPEKLKSLEKLVYNLWWSWNAESRAMFRSMSPQIWRECGHNPILLLSRLTKDDYAKLEQDPVFMARLEDLTKQFDDYMKLPRWFNTFHKKQREEDMLVAYFSAEYGLHESVQLYAGGLGILSGDHCKAASDLAIPFVAVGLLYRHGYFRQYTNADGWQQEYFPYNEFYSMPLKPAKTPDGHDAYVSVLVEKRQVRVRVWELHVGLIKIILLDTDQTENHPEDRGITGQLYGGDSDMRIRQEIVLGVAGIRALNALGIQPSVYHMNEGHPAFITIERIRQMIQNGVELKVAAEVVKKTSLFTTHTPVPAGFDVFGNDQINSYIMPIMAETGLHVNQVMGFGRENPFDEHEPFSMAICGIKMSTYRNGVSALHGEVSRKMFQTLWTNALEEHVPIGHVTNGVHLGTFIARDFKELFNRYLSEDWHLRPYDFSVWEKVDSIPDASLYMAKHHLRDNLIAFTRKELKEHIKARGGSHTELAQAENVLDPEVLTIGFARRFATYKRAYLLFTDEERLDKIVNNPEMPVQIIIAGKAHPRDNGGKEIIKKIINTARKPQFRNRIVFLEDYDIEVARVLTQGVDVWLNNPRRPMEASGTSGMKVGVNGGLNFSVLDGWWVEGYNGRNGWAIGAGEEYSDNEYQDYVEGMELYYKLETEIVPLFYRRDRSGLPREWLRMMKESLKTVPSYFSAARMVMEYTNKYYIPLHQLGREFIDEHLNTAREFIRWRDGLIAEWDGVHFTETDVQSGGCAMGEDFTLAAKVYGKDIDPQHLSVYAVVEFGGKSGVLTSPEFEELEYVSSHHDQHLYVRKYAPQRAGKLKVGFAVTPKHQFIKNIFEMNMIKWA